MSGPTMTGEERVAYLVKLAMEAHDLVARDVGMAGGPPLYRVAMETALTERMRQAAQVWQSDVDCAGDSK